MVEFPNLIEEDIIKNGNKIINEAQEQIQPLDYENSIFKDMANDIIKSQEQINDKLDKMMISNETSQKKTSAVSLWTLLIAVLTLIATIAGIVISEIF